MTANDIKIPIRVPPKAYQRLFEMGKKKGYQPSAFAQLLFDAAFAARVGQEKGIPASDPELDEQVRLVFACAGHGSPEAIAKATGMPVARVEKVLEALRAQCGLAKRGGAR